MKKRLVRNGLLIAIAMIATVPAAAQDKVEAEVGADLVSGYIWRGQDLGNVSIQPSLSLAYKGFSLSAWGSAGFEKSDTKELDFTLGYGIGGFSVSVTDYWFNGGPGYFHYGAHDTNHTFEAQVGYDFGVLALNWYTNFAGNVGYKANGERAYASYFLRLVFLDSGTLPLRRTGLGGNRRSHPVGKRFLQRREKRFCRIRSGHQGYERIEDNRFVDTPGIRASDMESGNRRRVFRGRIKFLNRIKSIRHKAKKIEDNTQPAYNYKLQLQNTNTIMKKIEAIIRRTRFDDVKQALLEADIEWFSYYDVRGVGKTREGRIYRGVVYDTSSIERILLSIVVREKNVEKTIQAILKAAQTGEIGDGRIFVIPVEDAVRISL